ncbi:23S rRNA (adenine(1618)-N(6))-methyltransferase RlmF [Psychromonas algicola]|uniref:23S rRNA (adenine(1618)-N(6))-methyltransferase RlmF n=1 Tax=Psychromonas algicola TaxID=2555642 RepID=UPI0010685DC3|nr:23S rRNA (adenine(1618)-N(6))-methyltransferase RlmF [Psychromonas sp. RZ5]TEW52440.1 23S rRNA (adenine(1618)-N(6))-methyltransferase RlmF [Psychromonas sp. RZ5]
MKKSSSKVTSVKGKLHPRNLHLGQYDFVALIKVCPDLAASVIHNPKGELTIDFSDAQSVLLLNRALLIYFYDIKFWQIPAGYLCPPIPGRVDYIHYIADLLSESFALDITKTTGSQIKGLDIGCGANCIYPILGSRSYDWSFVGIDIDALAIKTAKLLVDVNKNLSKKVTIRQQKESKQILTGIVKKTDRFAFTMCNPPFHASMEKATEGSLLKQKNLGKKSLNKQSNTTNSTLNFAGQAHELSCEGGEIAFVKQMVIESALIKEQVCWFTCLVSKSENVNPIKKCLQQQVAKQVRVIEMSQGHKISRFIAWSYLDAEQQKDFLVV